mgnify:FL=1
MTTSYVLQRQEALRELKQLERQSEASAMKLAAESAVAQKAASDARIAEKLKRIESGDAPATPAPKAKAEPKAKAAPKAKKPASKKSPLRRK